MTLAIVESSSGAASASARNPAITSGVAGRKSIPPTIVSTSWRRNLQPRGDAEVPAAAAQRPEQVGVVVGVDAQDLAVRRHDLGGEQVVDRHPVLADEEADAAG